MPSYNEHRYGHLEYVHPLENCSHSFRVIFSRDDSIEQRSSPPLWIIGFLLAYPRVGTRYIVSPSPYSISMNICRTCELRLVLPREKTFRPVHENCTPRTYPVNDILRAQRGYYSPKNHRGALLIFHSPSPALYTRPPRLVN